MYMAQLLGAVRNVGPYWAIADELQCVVEYTQDQPATQTVIDGGPFSHE